MPGVDQLTKKPKQRAAPTGSRTTQAAEAVLGSILLHGPCITEVELVPEDFSYEWQQQVFRQMQEMASRKEDLDVVTVSGRLQALNPAETAPLPNGGGSWLGLLSELCRDTPTWKSVTSYAKIVKDAAVARAAAGIGHQLAEMQADTEQVDEAIRGLMALRGHDRKHSIQLGEAIAVAVDELDDRCAGKRLGGVQSGFTKLDGLLGGFAPEHLIVIGARPAMGKCLGFGTPILMFDGTIVPVQDVRDGDLIMGPDSLPRTVMGTTRGREMLYRVTPKKGDAYTVNESHVLSVRMSGLGDRLVNISVLEYLTMPHRERAKGWRTGVEWPLRDVPLDPYFLGVWLGDGTTDGTIVHKNDEEVLSACEVTAKKEGATSKRFSGRTCKAVRIIGNGERTRGGWLERNPVRRKLDILNVINNKHVPHCYKANARSVREQVLAGLMDTDGHMTGCGFDFISKSKTLASDVVFLSRSLGLSAYMKKSIKSCQTGAVGEYWRVHITGDCSTIPTRVPRKRAPYVKKRKNHLRTGITVSPVGIGDYYGFEVDHDGLFLLGDFTVTHNTTMGMQLLLNNPSVPSGFMSTEMPAKELVQRACGTISGVSAHAMRLGKVAESDWPKITEAYAKLAAMPIFVNDTPSPTPFQVMRQARQWVYERDIKILVVDYIQHLKLADVRDKTQLLSEAVVQFKGLARELKIPVVLLAQVNRGVESRSDKRPNLGDYKDTGALEEEGDVVLSLYRDEVYNPKTTTDKGVIEIAVLKNRHGPTGYLRAHYNAACLRIEDLTQQPFE